MNFFIYFDILKWIRVDLLLNNIFVKVFVNFVLLILVGFKNIKELIGCLLVWMLDWLWWIVWLMVVIVLFWLIICLCNFFFKLRYFLLLVCVNFLIGILDRWLRVVIIWFLVMVIGLCFLFLWFVFRVLEVDFILLFKIVWLIFVKSEGVFFLIIICIVVEVLLSKFIVEFGKFLFVK